MSASVVTVAEAATRLAVSRSLIRKLLATGCLTRVRIGRCVRVRVEELEALAAGMPPATRAAGQRPGLSEESTFIDE
ncbi:MAG: helix-turn-helix domain-containing protein [Deltaproteobacteria bacterium]|nr:helix-turn-helix domain-containing protein [Deltaproteobacteria bacterium]